MISWSYISYYKRDIQDYLTIDTPTQVREVVQKALGIIASYISYRVWFQ